MNEVEKLGAIKHMGDIAATNIAGSMATMFGVEVEMAISSVNLIAVDSIPRLIGVADDEIVVGSFIYFEGFMAGSALCILTTQSAYEVAGILLEGMEEESVSDGTFTGMQQSALTEFTNIIASSFIDIWANTLNAEVTQHPPAFARDFMASIIDESLIDASKAGDFAFMFDSLLSVTGSDISLEVLVLPEMDSLQMVFDNITPRTIDNLQSQL